MIDRLQNALSSLEQLPPEAQEEAATYIEALVEALKLVSVIQSQVDQEAGQGLANIQWSDLLSALSNLPEVTSADLEQLQQLSQPTLPLEQS